MYGIPNMKLEKRIVQRRVDLMTQEGVTFVDVYKRQKLWPLLAFVLMWPLLGVLICLLVLLGQSPSAAIRAVSYTHLPRIH